MNTGSGGTVTILYYPASTSQQTTMTPVPIYSSTT